MNKQSVIFFLVILVSACNHIETSDTITKSDLEYIQSLGLLDKNERIIKFYSEYTKRTAGNFFSEKRIAKYWIDKKDTSKNELSSAFYKDIKSIDTVYYAGETYCPYMLITKKDNSNFKVCVEGRKEQIKAFFEQAISMWKEGSNDKD